jgi:hypothetical protein
LHLASGNDPEKPKTQQYQFGNLFTDESLALGLRSCLNTFDGRGFLLLNVEALTSTVVVPITAEQANTTIAMLLREC